MSVGSNSQTFERTAYVTFSEGTRLVGTYNNTSFDEIFTTDNIAELGENKFHVCYYSNASEYIYWNEITGSVLYINNAPYSVELTSATIGKDDILVGQKDLDKYIKNIIRNERELNTLDSTNTVYSASYVDNHFIQKRKLDDYILKNEYDANIAALEENAELKAVIARI